MSAVRPCRADRLLQHDPFPSFTIGRGTAMKTMLLIVIVLACVVVIVPALAKDYQVIRFGTDPTCPPFASKSTHA